MDKYAEKRLLHTPEGVRDIYGRELLKKLTVQDKLMHTFASFGQEVHQNILWKKISRFVFLTAEMSLPILPICRVN